MVFLASLPGIGVCYRPLYFVAQSGTRPGCKRLSTADRREAVAHARSEVVRVPGLRALGGMNERSGWQTTRCMSAKFLVTRRLATTGVRDAVGLGNVGCHVLSNKVGFVGARSNKIEGEIRNKDDWTVCLFQSEAPIKTETGSIRSHRFGSLLLLRSIG